MNEHKLIKRYTVYSEFTKATKRKSLLSLNGVKSEDNIGV